MALPSSQLVLLGNTPVGRLQVDGTGAIEFRLLESYKTLFPRPVLGQAFLDDPDEVWRSRVRLPAWFSNLLPEGALRELIARKADAKLVHEYALLHQLRDDLPGNVFLRDEEGSDRADVLDEPDAQTDAGDAVPWKFSLAGVQLKFSGMRSGERALTIPVSGSGGDWIVKLPDQRFPGVPANEHATMSWARASGIDVPEFELIEVSQITGLDLVGLGMREAQALAVRRFDRPQPGHRVHIEDFAQIVGVYPAAKYTKINYEGLGRLILAIASRSAFEEYLRRLVFMLASGNADAHLKNWSLIYRDGHTAELSPAYDLVSTIQYITDDTLALNLGGSKKWGAVSVATFDRLAVKLRLEPLAVRSIIEETVEKVLRSWRLDGANFGFTLEQRDRLDRHLADIPLLTRQ
jgi:serine/threonine-protein kinase HipA